MPSGWQVNRNDLVDDPSAIGGDLKIFVANLNPHECSRYRHPGETSPASDLALLAGAARAGFQQQHSRKYAYPPLRAIASEGHDMGGVSARTGPLRSAVLKPVLQRGCSVGFPSWFWGKAREVFIHKC